MTTITLDKDNSVDILAQFIDSGYKHTGIVSIKEAGVIAKYFRIIKGQEEKSEETKIEDVYNVLFKILDVLNANKAFTLSEGAVIDSVVTYIKENVLEAVEEVADK